MISVDEALRLLRANCPAVQTEVIAVDHAVGRTLAEPVIANISMPRANMSAMDGYAVRLGDVQTVGSALQVIGEAPAGHPFPGKVSSGKAVRIFTGSQIPEGADHVVIQENTTRTGETVVINTASERAANIRREGLDFSEGDCLIAAEYTLQAVDLSLIAAANHAQVSAIKRPVVGILANGDELKPPGSDLLPGQIVNSNAIGLAALVRAWGGEPVNLGIASDSTASIVEHIHRRDDIDIYLPVGGASVGDHDHMKSAFLSEGFEPVFNKVAVKPGKPTWFSRRGNQLVLGLPGNPASALVCSFLFLKPLLNPADSPLWYTLRLEEDLPANGGRESFLRAELVMSEDGRISVRPAS
ncbi:MAG: molybdopterin molybdenumtransferase MoeA, partial [Ponticaulis sp.]|nr:molybdopterin molybdenumtransferase MoeA [Ponticaulis sp.]